MIKKLFYYLTIWALLPASAIAGGLIEPGITEYNFAGFYLGANIGITHGIFRSNESTVYTTTGNLIVDINRFTLNDAVFTGGLQLGYGWQQQAFYFGLYAQSNFYDLSRKDQDELSDPTSLQRITFSTTARLTSNVSLGIKPGLLISPQTLLFAQIGTGYARLHLYTNNESTVTFANGTVATEATRGAIGIQFGLGIEHKISHRFSLWLSYLYNYYGHISERQLNNNALEVVNYSFGNYLFLLGLNYYINDKPAIIYRTNLNFLRGFYVGAFGGYQQMGASQNIGETLDIIGAFASIFGYSNTFKLADQNAVGGLQIGYQIVKHHFVINLSANSTFGVQYKTPVFISQANTFPVPVSGTFAFAQTSLTKRDYFGINIDPGYLISPNTNLFIRLGVVDSRFALVAKTIFAATAPLIPNNTFEHRLDWFGYRIGLGIRQQLSSHVALTLLDQYTFYPPIHFIGRLSTADAFILVDTVQIQLKPHNNQILLGLDYYFSS